MRYSIGRIALSMDGRMYKLCYGFTLYDITLKNEFLKIEIYKDSN